MTQQFIDKSGLFKGVNVVNRMLGLPTDRLANLFKFLIKTYGIIATKQAGGTYSGDGLASIYSATVLQVAAFGAIIQDANGYIQRINQILYSYDFTGLSSGTYNVFFSYSTKTNEAGTISFVNGSAAVVGIGTDFTKLDKHQNLIISSSSHGNNGVYQVESVGDALHCTLSAVFPGTSESGLTFGIGGRFHSDYIPGTPAEYLIYTFDDVTITVTTAAIATGQYWIAQVEWSGSAFQCLVDERTLNIFSFINPCNRILNVNEIPNLPASQITSGQLIPAQGGTGSDLHLAGGTGMVLKQKTVGGNIIVETLIASDIPNLDADNITAGTFDIARIPNLPASQINSGTFDPAQIPNLPASQINSGTFDPAQIPNLAASQINSGTFDPAQIPNLPASQITSGQLIPAQGGTGSDLHLAGGTGMVLKQKTVGGNIIVETLIASDIPNLDADNITAGTFDIARIPNLPASQINSGTFDPARIPNLPASQINSGTFDPARIPNLPASQINSGTFDPARIPNLPASQINSGLLALAQGGTNTDLSGTGGTGMVLKQKTVGGNIIVEVLGVADVPTTTPTNLTSGKALNVQYTNSNAYPIMVCVSVSAVATDAGAVNATLTLQTYTAVGAPVIALDIATIGIPAADGMIMNMKLMGRVMPGQQYNVVSSSDKMTLALLNWVEF